MMVQETDARSLVPDTLLRLPAVTTSVNGLNALALLRSQPNHFDLVLSDVVMPAETLSCGPPHMMIP